MASNTQSVYKVLQELFPHVAKVDTRLLRAVALEHSKDVDEAVLAVVNEVIPFLSERAFSSEIVLDASDAVKNANTTAPSDDALLADSTSLDETLNDSSFYDANDGHDQGCGGDGIDELVSSMECNENIDKVYLSESSSIPSVTLIHEIGAHEPLHHIQEHGATESEKMTLLGNCAESRPIVGSGESSHVSLTTLECVDIVASGRTISSLHDDVEDSDRRGTCDFDMAVSGENHQEQSSVDGSLSEVKNSIVQLAASPVQERAHSAPESNLQLVAIPDMLITDIEQLEPIEHFDTASKKDISTCEMLDLDGDSTLNKIITRSRQICSTDLLEDIIEDARSSKKTLFSTMESVISLMRVVELQEKAAEEAKEEAAKGGVDLFTRVEDLKQMLCRAKETNDMHSGEVYGEKAILATEVRELQSRVFSLSDERDKSLAILHEMSQTLSVRLAEAEKLRKEAEQERLEKEESAQKALTDQELIMETVVQESKILTQEAEENSKLREFLMDRGRVVDTLQGEMSVICQDVKLLKEKFDNRVPLSKSLISSQTSCILASSSSQLKNVAPDHVPEQADPFVTLKKTSPVSSIHEQFSTGEGRVGDDQFETSTKTSTKSSVHEQLSFGEETSRGDSKELVEEGWEFFDSREFSM